MRRRVCILLVAMSATLLIVDDEKNTRDGLRNALDAEFEVYVAPDADGALATLESVPVDVVLTDLRLGGDDGMSLIERIVKKANPPICIMMTAYGSVDTAVEAMKRGAYDFVTKPVNIDRLEILIKRALRERNTSRENKELRSKVQNQFRVDGMIGRSPAMVEVFDTIKQVAPSRATVLVQGESGTGKELAAHAIHELSPRSKEKFVAVHCASLTPELLASELFGHEKGAFTGAFERRIGRFEQAKGGTLFLDEIGEIDLTTQVKILRVLGNEPSNGLEEERPSLQMFASSPRQTKISPSSSPKGNSATTFSSACMWFPSPCRPSAIARWIFHFWWTPFCGKPHSKMGSPIAISHRRPCSRFWNTIGRGMSANCALRSSTASSWPRVRKSLSAICQRLFAPPKASLPVKVRHPFIPAD